MSCDINLKEKMFFDRMLRIPWMDHEKLRELRVGVVGLGNIGCPVAIMLYSLGLKELLLINRDEVELSNIQRRFMYTQTTSNST